MSLFLGYTVLMADADWRDSVYEFIFLGGDFFRHPLLFLFPARIMKKKPALICAEKRPRVGVMSVEEENKLCLLG